MQKQKVKKEKIPHISQKELVRVYGRIHSHLSSRVRITKKESSLSKNKDKKKYKAYVEAAKQLYAYVRLMELCQGLSNDVKEMREIINAIGNVSLTQSGKPN